MTDYDRGFFDGNRAMINIFKEMIKVLDYSVGELEMQKKTPEEQTDDKD